MAAIPQFVAGVALTAAELNVIVDAVEGGRPGVLLTDSQTITTATPTDITWGVEVSDPDGWTSGGSATLTVPAGMDGRYIVSFVGGWIGGAPGTTPGISCSIGGVRTYDTGGISAFASYNHTLTFVRTFVAGNTLKFECFHNAGANRDLGSRLEICPA